MKLEMGHYVGVTLQILLLALTVLGLVLNVLFLVLMVVVSLMYRRAMGYHGFVRKCE
jgi:hypothetical protein